jgi:hypothetical protein
VTARLIELGAALVALAWLMAVRAAGRREVRNRKRARLLRRLDGHWHARGSGPNESLGDACQGRPSDIDPK